MLKSFLQKGPAGLVNSLGYGAGAVTGHYAYKDRYGSGAGIGIGLAEAAIFSAVSLPVSLALTGAFYGGAAAMRYGQSRYKQRRQINLGTSAMNHGANAIKMDSIRKLSRDRYNFTRGFGNEAIKFHG